MTSPVPHDQLNLSIPVTALLRGVLYRDSNEIAWNHLRGLTAQVSDYVATLGLEVVIDDNQGYAFLRSLPDDVLAERGITRLVPRHRLSRDSSLLLALLRKRLFEFDSSDASDAGSRLVIDAEAIGQMMAPFMPTNSNQVQTTDKIDAAINKVVSLGFMRRIPKQNGQYEVRRVIASFVTADWLAQFDENFRDTTDPAIEELP